MSVWTATLHPAHKHTSITSQLSLITHICCLLWATKVASTDLQSLYNSVFLTFRLSVLTVLMGAVQMRSQVKRKSPRWQKSLPPCSTLLFLSGHISARAKDTEVSPRGFSPLSVWLTAELKRCNLVTDRFRAKTREGRSQLEGQLPNKWPYTDMEKQRKTR